MFLLALLSSFWSSYSGPPMKVLSERPSNFLFHRPLAMSLEPSKGALPQAWKAEVCRQLHLLSIFCYPSKKYQYFAILPKNKTLSWTIINLAAAPLTAMPPAVKKSAAPSVFQEGKPSYILYTWTKNYLCPMLLKYQPCFSYTNVCIVFFVLNNTDAVRISHSMATVSLSPSGNYTGQCAICVNDGWLAGFQPSINGSIPKYIFFCGGLQQIILSKNRHWEVQKKRVFCARQRFWFKPREIQVGYYSSCSSNISPKFALTFNKPPICWEFASRIHGFDGPTAW